MGSNSRHGSDVPQAAVNEVTTRPKPIGLTPAEIGDAITEAREPIDVTTHSGATSRVWVYANAVQRR